jgi:hypothetical protein
VDSADMVVPVPLESECQSAFIADIGLALFMHSGDMGREMCLHLEGGVASIAFKWTDLLMAHGLVPSEV